MLAWIGVCLGSSACTALWWPLGLVPVAVLVLLATQKFGQRPPRGR
jgi:hypothetical protein